MYWCTWRDNTEYRQPPNIQASRARPTLQDVFLPLSLLIMHNYLYLQLHADSSNMNCTQLKGPLLQFRSYSRSSNWFRCNQALTCSKALYKMPIPSFQLHIPVLFSITYHLQLILYVINSNGICILKRRNYFPSLCSTPKGINRKSSHKQLIYLCIRMSRGSMWVLQLLWIVRGTILAEEVIKSFSFFCRHFYTSRMKPE